MYRPTARLTLCFKPPSFRTGTLPTSPPTILGRWCVPRRGKGRILLSLGVPAVPAKTCSYGKINEATFHIFSFKPGECSIFATQVQCRVKRPHLASNSFAGLITNFIKLDARNVGFKLGNLAGYLPQKLQRFCVEALLIGSLEHPCILPIVRVEMSVLPFMVITERMQNGSLKDYLRACRPI